MKFSSCFFLIAFVIICFDLRAQSDDNYGKLRPEDINIKECSFDPSASLVIILDEGSTDYNSIGEQVTYRHVRMKVLKKDGLKYAEFSFTYPDRWDYMELDRLEGKCINVDENGQLSEYPVSKESIYNKKVNKYYRQVTFAFPQVKIGSILEYRYRITYTNAWGVRDWNFQREFPVYLSSYQFKSHPRMEVSYGLQKKSEYPVIIKQEPKGNVILFQMNNIPALEEEPYMDGREKYLQKVRFQITKITGYETFNSAWDRLAGRLREMDRFGGYLNTVSRDINVFVGSLTKNKSEFSKMKLIHDYVRNNLEFDGDAQILADYDLNKVWVTKKGTSGDINLLMIFMLRSAGLNADPVLISERDNGRVEKSFPNLDQFSNVFAAVTIEGKKYYLDGTDKLTPCNIIQPDILNTTGWLIRAGTDEFVAIEEQESKYKDIVVIEGFVQEDGTISGTAQVTSRDYARLSTINNYKEHSKNFVEKIVMKGLNNVRIDSFRISNIDNDSLPVVQNFNFKTNLQHSGEYDFATLNLFTGFTTNPFIAESRVSDVNFGFKTSCTINYVLNLPAGKTIDAAPKNIQLMNEDKTLSFSRQVVYNEQANQLVTRMKIELNKSLFKADQYIDLKEFYKKLNNFLEEPCVIKKK